MTDEKWRSPNNDYGPEVGLDNGDVETFKKEPEEALARETGQNSMMHVIIHLIPKWSISYLKLSMMLYQE